MQLYLSNDTSPDTLAAGIVDLSASPQVVIATEHSLADRLLQMVRLLQRDGKGYGANAFAELGYRTVGTCRPVNRRE